MKKILFLSLMWGAVVAMLTLNACTNEAAEVSPDANPEGDIKNVTFIAGGFDEGIQAQSRVDYTLKDGGGASFAWATGDTIGILPNEGSQVYFKINQIDENDPRKALFTGVAWGLKAGVDYAAYYPFIQDIMLDRTKVPVDYSVQSYNYQVDGEGQLVVSPSHSYQAAKPVERADGGLNFEFKHLGALVEVQFTLPDEAFEDEPVAIKQLTLMADDAIFPVKGTFSLDADPVVISPAEDEKAYFMTVNVTDLNATAGQPVSVFFMMPPMDGVDVNILNATVVYGEDDTLYPLSITSLKNSQDEEVTNLVAAKCYTLNTEAIDDFPTAIEITDNSTLSSNVNNVLGSLGGTKLRFVTRSPMVSETVVYTDDNEVNAYATRNGDWLEVHTLAESFKLSESAFYMFDANELNNYVNLTALDLSGFDTSSVTDMSGMFYCCSGLTALTFGEGFDTSSVTDMNYMFCECQSLAELDLSGFNTSSVTNMYDMFWYCCNLTILDLSNFTFSTEGECNYAEMFGYVGSETENVVIYVKSEEVITVLESLGSDYLYLPDYAQLQVKQSQPEN